MIEKHDYEKYFFNDLYDDKEIRDKIMSLQTHLYNDILNGKEWLQNNKVINGDIYDLRINKELNLRFNLPSNTYSLSLNMNIIPSYLEKKFFEKYGYGSLISSMDIIKDNEVFPKNFYFYINGYYIHNIKISILEDRCILFIPESHDLLLDDLNNIIDQPNSDDLWTILLSSKSDYYMTTLTRASLFTDNKIYLSKLSEYKKYNKPSKSNCWTMYITACNTSYNLMMATNVILDKDANGEFFLVPQEFKNTIKERAGTVRCLIINEPDCNGSGIYVNTSETDPVFEIPFKKNPIPIRNLLVWEYDSSSKRKLNPLTVVADIYYPNIYDFSNMISEAYFERLYSSSKELIIDSDGNPIIFKSNNSSFGNYDLYIEWIEPMEDVSEYDSYIQEYIECYKNDYVSMFANNTLPQLIMNYKPISSFKVGAMDYFSSIYKGDYRAWRLDKFIDLLKDNPKRFNIFYNIIYYKSKRFTSKTYTYEDNPHIYGRSILDNKTHCDDPERCIIFLNEEPHSFIRVYDFHDNQKPVSMYINGILYMPTYILKYGSIFYIYFPSYKIDHRESIQIEIEEFDNPIEEYYFRFIKSDTIIDLEDLKFKRKVALTNILFFNYSTGEYISKDDLNINAQIAIQAIQYIGTDKIDTIENLYTEIILADKNTKVIEPTDYDYIVLGSSEEEYEIINKDSNKDINLDNISISIKNFSIAKDKLLRNRIGIATTDFYDQRIFTVDQNYISTFGNTYTYKNFKGKPSLERFRIFENGLRVNPSNYTMEFNGYNKDVLITFISLNQSNYIIQYIGYDEECLYNDTISNLKTTNDDIIYLSNILSEPFNIINHRIYIDGYRISNSQIKVIEGNMIMIETSEIEYKFNNDSIIMIFGQRHDDNPYEYSTNLQFNDQLAISDSTFRNYLIDKYK